VLGVREIKDNKNSLTIILTLRLTLKH